MNRRDAIKRIGALAAGAVISSTGLACASNLINGNNGNMKILAINGSARKQGNIQVLAFGTILHLPPSSEVVSRYIFPQPLPRASSTNRVII